MAIVATWNPSQDQFEKYEGFVARTATGEYVFDRWSVGTRTRGIELGDRVFLFRQGADRRGIVAAGRVLNPEPDDPIDSDRVNLPIFLDTHWRDPGALGHYVRVRWERVASLEERLTVNELLAAAPGFAWARPIRQSGRNLSEDDLAAVEALWAERDPFHAPKAVPVALEQIHTTQYWTQGGDEGSRIRTEAELCARYVRYLAIRGVQACRLRIRTPDGFTLWTDIFDPENDELIEAKSDANRGAVRLAVGQLLDYRRYLATPEGTDLALLVPNAPSQDLLELLESQAISAIWPIDSGFTRSSSPRHH
ncbi:EVE domain-containing protein [Actinomycetospora soli]|uniref:EVE domain-containing protein n=1 Tax=Actinomycetospora soli TaxID=2893887 RepID=UPI001E58FB75|nr:EVE domain-containing protein [Actinomycetospora soli]MCD2191378.1 EVE domain-containing protein [Actinomycetospora soli]